MLSLIKKYPSAYAFRILSGISVLLTLCLTCERFEPERHIVLTIDTIVSVTSTSCVVEGFIHDASDEGVSRYGICWSTSTNPTILGDTIELGDTDERISFIAPINGLTSETEYFFRAFGVNNKNTFYGNEKRITTGEITLPAVTTTSANNVTETGAQIGGNVTDDGGGSVTERGVYYGTSSTPQLSGTKVPIGSGLGPFSTTLSGLTTGETYYFVAYATNSAGTSLGTVLHFTTGIEKLSITTTPASSVTETGAVVGGNVTDDGGGTVTERGVYYGTSSDPRISGTQVQIGSGTGPFSTTLSGLSAGVKYYFVAYAVNSVGPAYGNILSFETGVAVSIPSVTTSAAASVTQTSASIGGDVTSDGGATVTERGVYYGSTANPSSTGTKIQVGDGTGPFSTSVSGLTNGTTYYFVAYAVNTAGTSFGEELNFTTGQINPPAVSTTDATSVTETTANVGGDVTDDGGGSVTERGIFYGTLPDPKNSGTKVQIGSDTGPFSTTLSALSPGTFYYFVAYATNSAGTSTGTVLNFTTGVFNPTVTTTAASSIAETSATVGGNVTDDGGGTVTDRGIYYGTSLDPFSSGTKVTIGSGEGPFSTSLPGLSPGTRYYFVAYATNSAGTSTGSVLDFYTDVFDPSVSTSVAVSVTQTSAVIGGNVTDDGGGTVTSRGIYYGTSADPVASGTQVPLGSGTGPFSTTVTGLSPGETYYFVAYATNSSGTDYGSTLNFNTLVYAPTVTTSSATSVTQTTATVGGNVTDDGGGEITERGIYYSTSSNPMSGTKVTVGSGTGSFSTGLSGLSPGTRYYIAAYAVNSQGTAYGNTLSFTTLIYGPTVTTSSATSVTSTTATVGGNVTDDGGGTVTERGIYYGTSSNPASFGTKIAIGSGTGPFSTSLTGLSPSTRYYFVAYAINSQDTDYGIVLPFDTESSNTVTDYDGNVYQTVVIGSQTWTKENLKVTHYYNGTAIPFVESESTWNGFSATSKAYCWYENSASNGNTYGALYTWAAAMNGSGSSDGNPSGIQGVCPTGWHLPSDAEWKQMEIHLGMSAAEANNTNYRGSDQGAQIKEAGTTHWMSPNTDASNSSGFTALPGGHRGDNGRFYDIRYGGDWWTSAQYNSSNAWARGLSYTLTGIRRHNDLKEAGFMVRCVKD